MRVCIEAQPIVKYRTGIGRYVFSLIKEFSCMDSEFDISAFYFNFRRRFKEKKIFEGNVKEKEINWFPGFVPYSLWKKFFFPHLELFVGENDLYHFTNFAYLPIKKGKSIITFCDATIKRFPETMEEQNRKRLERLLEISLFKADSVIAISEFSKKELVELYQYPEEKIHAIHLGIEDSFKRITDSQYLDKIREKYNFKFPFLLYVGTIEPRKNIIFMLKAFEKVAKKSDCHLVLVGRAGWKTEKIFQYAENSKVKEKIHFLGYVDEGDLPAIYNMAELFLFPSLYEGFGFPPLEAMKCGTPVVSSDCESLKEILKDGAEFFSLTDCDTNCFAEKIICLLNDNEKKRALSEKGKKIANTYSWNKTARETLSAYKKVLKLSR